MKNDQMKMTGSKAKVDSRTQIKPAPAPQVGFLTDAVEKAIAAGPAGIRQAQHVALKYAKKYQEESIDYWRKKTDFLKKWGDSRDRFNRARARCALVWRPRFLAALSMTNSVRLSARHARISRKMAYEHRERDKEFAEHWDEAIETAVDLLHAKVFQRCLEGDLEPVFHMGVVVGYVRKFDSRLQIEFLRAYRPQEFKTPGTQVNIGTRGDIFVLTEDQRHELQRINREWLLSSSAKALEAGATASASEPPT
jgi:hypothetical protein